MSMDDAIDFVNGNKYKNDKNQEDGVFRQLSTTNNIDAISFKVINNKFLLKDE